MYRYRLPCLWAVGCWGRPVVSQLVLHYGERSQSAIRSHQGLIGETPMRVDRCSFAACIHCGFPVLCLSSLVMTRNKAKGLVSDFANVIMPYYSNLSALHYGMVMWLCYIKIWKCNYIMYHYSNIITLYYGNKITVTSLCNNYIML